MAHVAQYKKDTVDEFVQLIKEYPIIAAVNMENLPTPQLQKMRAQLRGKIVLKMTKRRLLKLAFDKAKQFKPGVEKLVENLSGMPALLFTKDNPFRLYKILQQNKSSAPAKAGQVAPKDLVIPAGPTSFMPGPIIGELAALGIKAGVEGGKIAIKEDKVVAKQGEIIKQKVAELLLRFNITPMEVGLDLTAAYENGTIFTKSILHIDEKEYEQNIMNAASWATNLAFEIGYPIKEIIELMLNKAHSDAEALALSQDILTSGTTGHVLAKAHAHMHGLKAAVNLPETFEENSIKNEESAEESKKKTKNLEHAQHSSEHHTHHNDDASKADHFIEQIKKGKLDLDEPDIVKGPSAEDLVNEIADEDNKEKRRLDALKVPSAHELLERKMKKEGGQ
jgi:large subunit ribosomal protein L10